LQKLNRENGITIVLVTHEQDIAACASRVITFRDGRMVSDIRQERPSDALAELEALPPPQAQGASDYAPESNDAAAFAREQIGGPVPIATYFMAVLGLVLGWGTALLYGYLVVGQHNWWFDVIGVALGEALLAAWHGKRR